MGWAGAQGVDSGANPNVQVKPRGWMDRIGPNRRTKRAPVGSYRLPEAFQGRQLKLNSGPSLGLARDYYWAPSGCPW